MSTILKANNTETPCEAAEHYRDSAWGRPTCTVTIKGSAADVAALLPDNAAWSLIEREDVLNESGMEYEYGKYYLDSEDGKTYLCERTGEAAGGKIVLQYLPHELVGNYFKAVSA